MTSTAESAVAVAALSKTFTARGRSQRALDGVSLQVARGEMVALLGPSGSGKSTLLRHLSGLEIGDVGHVSVLGRPVQTDGSVAPDVRRIRRRVGFVFQQYNLVSRSTLLRNVLVGMLGRLPKLRTYFGLFRSSEKQSAMAALARVGMADFAGQRASHLSGGQQQRGAIARALVQGAEVILADEPVASLDPRSAEQVMQILKEINERDGITVVVSLHQVEYASRFCQRIVGLRDGRIVYDGLAQDLTPQLLHDLYGLEFDGGSEEAPAP